ncbi:MAG: glutamate-5-semialdehyde dehydrogenase [Pseudomonadota bacterium]
MNDSVQSRRLGNDARAAASALSQTSAEQRDAAIDSMAKQLVEQEQEILAANALDVASAERREVSAAMVDRLTLDRERLASIAAALRDIASMADPLGRVIGETTRPNGLHISKVTVPLGVIGIIYESRPNVTADAAAICLKAGNAVLLRGGTDSANSSNAIVNAVRTALDQVGMPVNAIQRMPDQDRRWVGELLSGLHGSVDVVVPRGGRGLVERVQRDARVPVIGHLEGLCHTFIHHSADEAMALAVVVNAKMRRTGICGALEKLLIDVNWPTDSKRALLANLIDSGCELRGDAAICSLDSRVLPATESDWRTEYLAPVLTVAQVADTAAAVNHIATCGSGHTDAIVAADTEAAEHFLARVDSAIVMHNASTQFADGGEFGLGAEIGISTGKLHARGPVGAQELTSYKHVVRGAGQTRA